MRILKEYHALTNPPAPTEINNVRIALVSSNIEKVAEFVEQSTQGTNIGYKTLISLKVTANDIFEILSDNAASGEEIQLSCSYHKYYYMMSFEFSESALPLHTLNKSVKLLNAERNEDTINIGFMDLVHLVDRIELSVDKAAEKMRLTVIKEKQYSIPEPKELDALAPLKSGFTICDAHALANDFSLRLYKQFGKNIDKFLISPTLFADNLAAGELDVVFLKDEDDNCVGGAVWQKTFGIIVLMVFAIFAESDSDVESAKSLLLQEFQNRTELSGANFIVSQIRHSEIISDYLDVRDEKYCYKSLLKERKHVSYIKPDLIPIIKKAYQNLDIDREIRQINYNHSFIEPHSVLTAKVDADASEAVLSVMWFGDDLKSNIIRHVIALKRIGIESIYFKLNLSVYEETAVSDLVQECGFEAKYLLPYSSDMGDTIVFVYCDNDVYEMKPCVISLINKANIEKTPALVRKVYGDNYPSKYLYNPEQLWEKIRKRHLYPYIAIDDEQNAAGMISFVKLGTNPYLYEIGQLMVDPAHRGTNIVNQLIEYVYTTAIQNLDFDAI